MKVGASFADTTSCSADCHPAGQGIKTLHALNVCYCIYAIGNAGPGMNEELHLQLSLWMAETAG